MRLESYQVNPRWEALSKRTPIATLNGSGFEMPVYDTSRDRELWWCNAHQRQATFFDGSSASLRCDPKLGGIMIPCDCVDLTGIAEIVDEPDL